MSDEASQLQHVTAAFADRYTIERRLGVGGMATVYLAEDLKHKRKVALKVLKPDVAAVLGAERFVQEIQTTANLQHPHILPLFDSGTADGFLYYVMPFIEGETLREKLNREKQLGIDEAVKIAIDVADALDYAHRHHVIHRDIKPANILLHDGSPMVADFGIALAVSVAGADRLTETGLSLGTPHYMSPEQAAGEQQLTARSDVYALGATLYEMLGGDPPFSGHVAQAIVARVITDEPRPLREVRKTVPAHVAWAVHKALQKLPADRFASGAEFAEALANPGLMPATPVGTAAIARPTVFPARVPMLWALAVAAATLVALWGWLRPIPAEPSVYDVGLPDSAPISFSTRLPSLAVAPDGRFAVYAAQRDTTTELWYRSLVDTDVRRMPGTDGAYAPMVSPDGRFVAFFAANQLNTVSVSGGVPTSIAVVSEPSGGEWLANGRILVADNEARRLRWFDPEAGEVAAVPVTHCLLPHAPDELEHVVCSSARQSLYVVSGRDGKTTTAARARGSHARVVDGRYLTYMSLDGNLRAASFDGSTFTVGRPVTLVTGVRRKSYTGAGEYAVAASGTLVYAPGANAEVGRFVKVRGDGPPQPLPIDPAVFLKFSLSKDGQWLATVVRGAEEDELRIYDLTSGQHVVWLRAVSIREPLWTPAGDRILVGLNTTSGDSAVTLIGAPTVAAPPDTLLEGIPWDPFTYYADTLVIGWEPFAVQALGVNLSTNPPTIDTLVEGAYFPTLSPDGRWLVYTAIETGQLVLLPYPSRTRRFQVSNVGWEPQWLSASELVYWVGSTWYRASVAGSAERPVGLPRPWFTDPRFADTPGQSHEATPDGGVIYLQGPAQASGSYLRVVPNWVKHMKRAADKADR